MKKASLIKSTFICRFEDCKESFDHRQKRIRHEKRHEEIGETKIQKKYMCNCCEEPIEFYTSKERKNHQYYMRHKKNFKC